MTLNIISAEKIEYTGNVSMVTLPGTAGLFTVLENHAALLASLTAGKVVYRESDDAAEHEVEIKGGIADVDHNVVSVCLY